MTLVRNIVIWTIIVLAVSRSVDADITSFVKISAISISRSKPAESSRSGYKRNATAEDCEAAVSCKPAHSTLNYSGGAPEACKVYGVTPATSSIREYFYLSRCPGNPGFYLQYYNNVDNLWSVYHQ